jgi:hypothetical protein
VRQKRSSTPPCAAGGSAHHLGGYWNGSRSKAWSSLAPGRPDLDLVVLGPASAGAPRHDRERDSIAPESTVFATSRRARATP